METGIYQIEFFDGSKWNLYFANSTQHKNILLGINENKDLIKSTTSIVNGIHTANKIYKIFQIIKERKNENNPIQITKNDNAIRC